MKQDISHSTGQKPLSDEEEVPDYQTGVNCLVGV